MDPKKQDLKGELKEIYERVMNTQIKAPVSQPLPQQPYAPIAPPAMVGSQPGLSAQAGSFPSAGAGAQPQSTAVFASPAGGAQISSTPVGQANSLSGTALGQSAPIENKPFVFTGNKVTTQDSHSQGIQMKKISGPIIAVLVLILVVVWGLFWAKFFGLI